MDTTTLNDATIRLLKKDGFFANLLFLTDKVFDEKVKTLGVGFVGNKLTLFVAPSFFDGLTIIQQEEALIHECEHIIKGHLFKFRNKSYNRKIYNIAKDIQINERLTSLHEFGCTAEKYSFPKDLISDEYYKLLIDKAKDSPESGEGETFDSHDKWDTEATTEAIEAEIKDVLEKAINNTKNKGSIPGSAFDTLEKLQKKAEVPWHKELKRYIGKLESLERTSTRMKKNRRFGWIYAGNKTEQNKLNISLCIDTSGSVSDDMIKAFFCEIDKIHSNGHTIKVIEIDTKVQKTYEYKPKKQITIHGRGGTMYQPALDESKKNCADIILFFGDGGCFDSPVDVGIPTIWILGKGQSIQCNFGKKININC